MLNLKKQADAYSDYGIPEINWKPLEKPKLIKLFDEENFNDLKDSYNENIAPKVNPYLNKDLLSNIGYAAGGAGLGTVLGSLLKGNSDSNLLPILLGLAGGGLGLTYANRDKIDWNNLIPSFNKKASDMTPKTTEISVRPIKQTAPKSKINIKNVKNIKNPVLKTLLALTGLSGAGLLADRLITSDSEDVKEKSNFYNPYIYLV